MRKFFPVLLVFYGLQAFGQEAAPTEPQADGVAVDEQVASGAAEPAQTGPRTMSGMSILGNEEAPKALVIVPWKSSELGDELGMNDSLDDLAKPVDRAVFMRELRYFQIRSGG